MRIANTVLEARRSSAAVVTLLTLLGVGLISAPVWADSGAPLPKQIGETGDGVRLVATAAARTEATDYWVEYGSDTAYAQQTAHQRIDAGPDTDVTFAFQVPFRGPGHFRTVAASAADPTVRATSQDFTFSADGIRVSVAGLTVGPGSVTVDAGFQSRPFPTSYWVEYGSTTDYGSLTPVQSFPADSTTTHATFPLTGLPSGPLHFRLAAQSDPSMAPDVSGDTEVNVPPAQQTSPSSGSPSYWPHCSDSVSTQCVMSVTLDGAPTSAAVADVFMGGGGLQIIVHSDHGPLVYDGGPVTAASTVGVDVNIGTYQPDVLLGAGKFDRAATRPTDHGNIISFSAHPLRMSSSSTCRIGDCGDDTTRAEHDEAGKIGLSAFTYGDYMDRAYVTASKGMWISSNASGNSTPAYDPGRRAVVISMAGPHLTAAGEVNQGYYQSFLPTAMFTDLWHISGPEELATGVSSADGDQPVMPRWTSAEGGWLCTLDDFHFSSPTITFAPTGGTASAPTVSQTSAPAPAPGGYSEPAPDSGSGPSGPAPQPAPTPTGSPEAAPTSSPTPSSSPATPPTPTAPRITLSTTLLQSGAGMKATYAGTPDSRITMWARTAPATTYSRLAVVTLNDQGLASWAFAPRRNTRFLATDEAGARSNEPLLRVTSHASLRASVDPAHVAHFDGSVFPALAGRLVSVYRNGVLFAQGRTSSSGVYSITRRLAVTTTDVVHAARRLTGG